MKIAFVTKEFSNEKNIYTGIGNHLRKLVLSLNQRGHNIYVYETTYSNMSEECLSKNINLIKIPLKFENIFLRLLEIAYFSHNYQPKIFVNIKQFSSLITRVLNYYRYGEFVRKVSILIKKNNIDIVVYISDYGISFFAKHYNIPYVNLIVCHRRLLNEANDDRSMSARFIESIEKKSIKKCLHNYAPSILTAGNYKIETGRNITVIETPYYDYGIHCDKKYVRYLSKKYKNYKYLLFYGSLNKVKGIKEIGDSIYNILTKYPTIILVLCGELKNTDNFNYLNYIKDKAKNNSDRVVHFGPLEHKYLYPLISSAYAILLPSRNDNLPNACIESMSLKQVIIGSEGASFEQLIKDNYNGILCKARHSKSIEKAIDRLFSMNENEIRLMKEKAKERIKDLSPEIVVKQVEGYFQNIINKN